MGEDDFYAAVSMFAGTYAPVNYALCQGQQFASQQYTALYALLSSTYSTSVSSSVFNLPNLAAAIPVGVGQASSGTYTTLGATGQAATFALSNGMPAAMTTGDTPTVATLTAAATVGINYVICVNGYWPSRS